MKTGQELQEILREGMEKVYERWEDDLEDLSDQMAEGEHDDFSSIADEKLTETIVEYFEGQHGFNVLTEETDRELSDSDFTVIADEFDGTDNMMNGRGELPFCPILAIADKRDPEFEDVQVAGILELNSGNYYEAVKGEGATVTENWSYGNENAERIQTSDLSLEDDEIAGIHDDYMLGDLNWRILQFFNDEEIYPGDFRSWAEHGVLVARGAYEFAISGDQCIKNQDKRYTAEELAALYLLVNEAGGAVTDFYGNDIGSERIGFQDGKTFDTILANSESLGKEIAEKLQEDYLPEEYSGSGSMK